MARHDRFLVCIYGIQQESQEMVNFRQTSQSPELIVYSFHVVRVSVLLSPVKELCSQVKTSV